MDQPPVRTLRGKLPWLVLAAGITALDLWSKHALFTHQTEGRVEWLLGDWLGLTRVWNRGMMWGALQDWGWLLRHVRTLAALVVLWMIVSTDARARLLQLALALVLGGALGNIYDGYVFGRVRDFVIVQFDGVPLFDPFPVFNVADSAICVGVGLLALGLMLDGRRSAAEAAAAAADGGAAPASEEGRKSLGEVPRS